MPPTPVDVARRLAEEVLFPGALATDRSPVVPVERLDALAEAGFYGIAGPPEHCPMIVAGPEAVLEAIEILAGACLTTTFVWMQHHRAVVAAAAVPVLRERWLPPLCEGRLRAGIAFSSLRRSGPPLMTARPAGDGWRFDGVAPWVTGWGRIDVVLTAARNQAGDIVWALVDAVEGFGVSVEPLDLAAVAASATVTLRLDAHRVAADRVTSIQPYDEWARRDAGQLRRNGALALGVAARSCTLLGPSSFDAELRRCRASLDGAPTEEMPAARARASDLAVRASAALVASGGGRSIVRDHHAQRLAREALFLLVFGQTPAIRAAQRGRWRVDDQA